VKEETMMTRKQKLGTGIAAGLAMLLVAAAPLRAELQAGQTIDKSNWQEVKDLLPESMLNYVKKGDYILKIGKLSYEPVFEPKFQSASESNGGKYGIDNEGGLIDPKTGKRPEYIYGFPFPKIDPKDPNAGVKVLWNKWYALFKTSQNYFPFSVDWVGRGGFERRITAQVSTMYYDGRAYRIPNPDATELREIIQVLGPASVQGIVQLTWRYMDNRPDSVWSYAPAIRRTRQLTSANRSDPFLGSDFVNDDSSLWFGKNQSFTWKLIGQQDVLVQTAGPNPVKLDAGQKWEGGQEWKSTSAFPGAKWGWEDKGWTGAPWVATNMIWVKRPVWVVEGQPKDPYYSYGRQIFYVDRENYGMYYKIIYNRAGEYWKTVMVDMDPAWNPDGSERYGLVAFTLAIDDKTDHASTDPAASSENIFQFNTPRMQPPMFTVDGLLRFGK
jgi:hypothetical protein